MNILKLILIKFKEKLMVHEMNRIDKGIIEDLKKYLEKKRKIGKARHGFERGQRELIIQISKKLRKLAKEYVVK